VRKRLTIKSPSGRSESKIALITMSVQAGTMPVPEFFDAANVARYLQPVSAPRA
jgi:hypothetical protein